MSKRTSARRVRGVRSALDAFVDLPEKDRERETFVIGQSGEGGKEKAFLSPFFNLSFLPFPLSFFLLGGVFLLLLSRSLSRYVG